MSDLKPIVRIKRGDKPVSDAMIEGAKTAYMEARGWTAVMRDDAMVEPTLLAMGWIPETPAFMAAMQALSGFENSLALTLQINQFNRDLAAYQKAVARLSRYRLADGRSEMFEDRPTGEFDEGGNPITQSVLVASAVNPLPATIGRDVIDPETGEVTGSEDVPNPAIIKDDEERAEAQVIVDQTPEDVKSPPAI